MEEPGGSSGPWLLEAIEGDEAFGQVDSAAVAMGGGRSIGILWERERPSSSVTRSPNADRRRLPRRVTHIQILIWIVDARGSAAASSSTKPYAELLGWFFLSQHMVYRWWGLERSFRQNR